ncbi:glycosyltransferase 87 family protein [Pseudonocardia sp. RS11V-5]|uniref:glycosyltransferase 87 family protein n=1 Tax=Pseudonocardia terrae TaxID=2905831 RepID=UPI001E50F6AB|nr:glycosyltransferase 87 family protein [Pseudonocardia terrae]MCE3554733.1 glycosyltransferase 87 family protein [Pseudonocardia terrae]
MTLSSTRPGAAEMVRRVRLRVASPRSLVISLPLLAISVTALLLHTHGYHIDLEVYRLGVDTWLHGGDMYGPLPPTISGLALPFIYPVFAAMVLTPLALLPWTPAWVLLFVLSLTSLAVTLYLATRRAWPAGGRGGAVSVAFLALPALLWIEPVLQTFEFGQVNIILMALVAIDCLAPRTPWPRGLLVGLAAAIKLTPAAFVLFFLLRRDVRAAVVTVVTAAAATALGFLVDAHASATYWFGGPAAGVSGSVFYTNETVQAVVARWGIDGPLLTGIWVVVSLVLLVLLVPTVRRADPAIAMSAMAAFMLLVSPTSWSHHWVWVAPAVLAVGAHAVRTRRPGWIAVELVLLVAFYLAPFRWLPGNNQVELGWNAGQQLVGATYVIVAIALLVVAWRYYARRPPEAGPREPADGS